MTNGNIYRDVTVHGHQVHLGNVYISKQDDVLESPAVAIESAWKTLDLATNAVKALLELSSGCHAVEEAAETDQVPSAGLLQNFNSISRTFHEKIVTWELYKPNIAAIDSRLGETRDQILQSMQIVSADLTTNLDLYKTKQNPGDNGSGNLEIVDRIERELGTQIDSLASALGLFASLQLQALHTRYPIFRDASDDVIETLVIDTHHGVHVDRSEMLKQIGVASAVARHIDHANRLIAALGASHQRYQDVADAATGTYNWLVEGLGRSDHTKLEHNQLRASEKFIDWLKKGNGLFHIVGKPGSGKSTAMKVVAKHPATRQLLSCWAGGSRVVLAKFFFWKPSGPLQNSIEGLMRGILFDVLRTAPELAEVLFPVNSVTFDGGNGHLLSQIIASDSVRKAFQTLTSSDLIGRSHRICFFIDGLDEYEVHDDFVLLNQFVTQLQAWSSKPTCTVKLCVSSRDLPVFRNLASEKKLWLHLHTKKDMASFIDDRLCGDTLPDRGLSWSDRNKISEALLERADGVFLWLQLVVGCILEGIFRGDSAKTLQKQVLRMPKGLRPLFEHLLAKIPEVHAAFAHLILAVVMRLHGFTVDEENRAMRLADSRPPLTRRATWEGLIKFKSQGSNQHVALSSFYVLADLWDSNDGEEKGFDFSRQVPAEALAALDIERATVQVHGISGGLLEVVRGDAVKFTHRSIPEFLEEILQARARQLQIKNADVSSALCWLMLAEMQCFETPKAYLFTIGPQAPQPLVDTDYGKYVQSNPYGLTLEELSEHRLFSKRFYDFLLALRLDTRIPDLACAILNRIEHLANEQWQTLNVSFKFHHSTGYDGELLEITARQPKLPTMSDIACYMGMHEYLTWDLSNLLHHHNLTNDESQHNIYHVGLGILNFGSSHHNRTADTVLRKRNPMLSAHTDRDPDFDRLWIEAVLHFVCSGLRPRTGFWVFLQDLMKYGERPQCYLLIQGDWGGGQQAPHSWLLFECYHGDGKFLGIQFAELDGSYAFGYGISSNDPDQERRARMLAVYGAGARLRIEFESVISFFSK